MRGSPAPPAGAAPAKIPVEAPEMAAISRQELWAVASAAKVFLTTAEMRAHCGAEWDEAREGLELALERLPRRFRLHIPTGLRLDENGN